MVRLSDWMERKRVKAEARRELELEELRERAAEAREFIVKEKEREKLRKTIRDAEKLKLRNKKPSVLAGVADALGSIDFGLDNPKERKGGKRK